MKLFMWLRNRFNSSGTFNVSRSDNDMVIRIAPDGTKNSLVVGSTCKGKSVAVKQAPTTIIEYVDSVK